MPGQVPLRVKQERFDRLMRTQQTISLERNKRWEGRELRVLVDENKDGWIAGRSFRDAPEIDGWIYARGDATPGTFATVTVTEAKEHDLYGHLAGADAPLRQVTPLKMSPLRQAQ
jgi:ribosomal protein S12 methylthiotransferase